jgi:hypothetical protein
MDYIPLTNEKPHISVRLSGNLGGGHKSLVKAVGYTTLGTNQAQNELKPAI